MIHNGRTVKSIRVRVVNKKQNINNNLYSIAKDGAKRMSIDANEAFLQYEEEIANNPVYKGMPDLRYEDGSIQWEAPSNRSAGVFQFTHDKRYRWWVEKAAEIGISTDEDKWISRVAKTIHPTKQHPCKVCGRVMDIRYCYLSVNFMKRVKKLSFYDGSVEMDEVTHILDFVTSFIDTYGDIAYDALPSLLKCTQIKEIPHLPHNLSSWNTWIEQTYIPSEPSMLGPGTMSNAPDRLDGFHTFNRCCRSKADKGRSKENLASYSTDRRAFENWSDGNWITANKLMGYISSNSNIKTESCANEANGGLHPRPCSADHIGPISLGFCHRPEFQLLCTPCNSSKNNRMYFSDVCHLINVENSGETVVTWYAKPIWEKCKSKVVDKETALKLSRIMRDNRNIALQLLASFIEQGEYLFLLTFLNLEYTNYEYELIPDSVIIKDHIVKADFTVRESTLRYANIQKVRKIRVAFNSLLEYAQKDNRNGFTITNQDIERLQAKAFDLLTKVNETLKEYNKILAIALTSEENVDSKLEAFLAEADYNIILQTREYEEAKVVLIQMMELVAEELASNWNNPRYSRDIFDE